MRKLSEITLEKDLLAINGLSIMLVLAIAFFPESALRFVLGLPFILFFPGYALTSALFISEQAMEKIERVALSLGLSVAVVPLVGLALNYLPWGIRLAPIVASLFVFTLALSAVAFLRRTSQRSSVNYSKGLSLGRTSQLAVIIIAAIIVLAAALTVYPNFIQRSSFSEFYILDQRSQSVSFPVEVTIGQNRTVTLGVVNHENCNISYSVAISLGNQTLETNNIQLANGSTWLYNYTFTPQSTGQKTLNFTLYKEGITSPYRALHLQLNVQPQK